WAMSAFELSRPAVEAAAASRSGPSDQRCPVRCREIGAADVDGVVELLTRGFGHGGGQWSRALRRMADHEAPAGFPQYGYLLESEGRTVGALLLIFARVSEAAPVRCNVSSWYVEPAFRSYGPLLARYATRRKDVTYFNLTPAPPTWRMLRAEGYTQYAQGRFAAVPLAARPRLRTSVRPVGGLIGDTNHLPQAEFKLLFDHARRGCASLVCDEAGEQHPFVFAFRRLYGLFPVARLVYCRDLAAFVRFAGPLGRFLARRGCLFVFLDTNGPLPGLVGRYSDHSPKFYKGPCPMRAGDIAYSEQVMFGDWSDSRGARA
ncbi:MAG: hypothetical protein JOY66_02975, partial [Acetobacteraceae bacterium]|nr:hypothetical protein [Acetobacteraceae bacterium]